ncbi:MAG: EscU/YscU/HrcU family type III secretion system export apparatus switch protein [Opitutales bacterium]|nr:EscU/YscU/HrcU family type III secretion system export apparatus switch protein [Opitutales bacterium]
MADVDKSSKTEPPTEKRLSESRSKGQFAKAPEISMTFTMLAGLLVIVFLAPAKASDLLLFTRSMLENINSIQATQEGVSHTLTSSYFSLSLIVIPMLASCFLAALIAEGLQTGFRFTPKAIEPKFNKLNPITGFQKIFGLKALKAFFIDLMKFLSIGTVVWITLLIFLDDPIFYTPVPIQHLPAFIYKLFLVMFTILLLMLSIIAIINYFIKKKEHDDEMKMTKQEVKEERKSKEVSSEVKTAQRKKAMELLGGQGVADVSTADVVVTNPTHYAVALRYEKGTDNAPVVVAKGDNLLARRIKIIAKEHEVPMIENKPVAQTLFALGRVGEPIPLQMYQVVASILADVYKKHAYYFHRLKARRLLAKMPTTKAFS